MLTVRNFSHQSNGTNQENFSLLKPVQSDVQEGPVETTFVVSLLWQRSSFPLQLMMLWK